MKRFGKVLALVLCVTLILTLFAACKGGGGDDMGNIVYGRYVEEDISPEGMQGYPSSFVSFSDGSMDLITRSYDDATSKTTMLRWRSADGGQTWQSMDMSWADEYIVDYSDYYERGETPPEEISLGGMYPMENGDVIFQVYRYLYDKETENYDYNVDLFRLDTTGNKTTFSVPEMDALKEEFGGTVNINDIRPLPGGRMYLYLYAQPSEEHWNDPNFDYSSAERRAVYDVATGEKLYDLNFEGWEIFYNSTTMFLNDYEKGYVAINLADGTPSTAPMPKPELLQQLFGQNYMGTNFVDDDNNFYSVSARGMEMLAPDAEAPERVMDGLNYTYGSPLYSINGMVRDPKDDALVMVVYNSSQSSGNVVTGKLLRYMWDDEAIASSDRKIRVYSLYENYSVRLGLSEFKRQNPDVTIEYETAFAEDNSNGGIRPMMGGGGAYTVAMAAGDSSGSSGDGTGQTVEDALRALNTELLNGTGPDVLILDGLPVESFIEKGVLEDLSSHMSDNLVQSLFAPMQRDGKIYAMPTNFYAPTLFGESGYVQQFTSFESLLSAIRDGAGIPGQMETQDDWTDEQWNEYWQQQYAPRPAEEQPVLYFESYSDLFNTFFATCAPAIFSEKGGIDQNNLNSFLQAMKEVSDKYKLLDESLMGMGGGMVSFGYSSYGYAQYEYSQTLNRYGQRQSRLGYSRLGTFNELQNVASNLHWSAQPQSYGKTEVAYDEDGNIVEPAETEQPETLPKANPALVSAPGLSTGVYFPMQMVGVTTTGKKPELAHAFVDAMLSDEVQKYDMGNGFPVTVSAFDYQTENYLVRYPYEVQEGIERIPFDYNAYVAQLNTPFYSNDYLRSVIYTPVESYCAGKMDLNAAVEQIVKETELYFAERQ